MIKGFLILCGFVLLLWWAIVNPHTAAGDVRNIGHFIAWAGGGIFTFLDDVVHGDFAPRPAR